MSRPVGPNFNISHESACHMAFEYEGVKKLLEISNRSRIIYITVCQGQVLPDNFSDSPGIAFEKQS